jgi:hypothetical protein
VGTLCFWERPQKDKKINDTFEAPQSLPRYGKGADTETLSGGAVCLSFCEFVLVFGHFVWVSGLVSDPPGPILESVFLWRVSVDRNLPVHW